MNRSELPIDESGPLGAFDPAQIVASVGKTEAVREMLAHSSAGAVAPENRGRPLHRLAAVREEQSVSLTRVAKRLSIDIAEARRQSQETTDLLLSQLYRWREILEVPVGELVIEPEEIPNNPVRNRGQLIKIMKTARTIRENVQEENLVILTQLLIDQLVEMMPELANISAWPSVGQAREQRDLGQAVYRRFDSAVSRRLED